ncbi:MAG: hypothetical protein IPH75_03470 [bacterium]|nr:hypothetical protein [bacterium]
MSTRTEQRSASTAHWLSEIVSRHGRVFYSGTGFPQLFERIEQSGEHHFDNTWIYIPAHYLQMVADQSDQRGERTGIVWAEPILCDDRSVFPLLYRGEVVAMLSSDTSVLPEFDSSELNAIQGWCAEYVNDSPDQVRERCGMFVRELFRGGDSPQQFMKRAMTLLTNGWSRSCAGLYVESQGTFWLNLAIGDVSRWFRLVRHFHPEAAMRMLESVYRHEYFIPADTIGDYPTFLDVLPDFYFVHEGMLSPRAKQFILMSGPGAITRSQAMQLQEYARLVSGLQEFQFASGSELIPNFSRLAAQGVGESTFEQMLTETWNWLSQQISLSRVAILCRLDDSPTPCGLIIQRQQDGETQLARMELQIPPYIIERLKNGNGYAIEDVRGGELVDTIAKERYLHHILSEYYLPIQTPAGVIGAAVFSAPSAGDYLTMELQLLEAVTAYFSLWMQMDRRRDCHGKEAESVTAAHD